MNYTQVFLCKPRIFVGFPVYQKGRDWALLKYFSLSSVPSCHLKTQEAHNPKDIAAKEASIP